MTDPVLAALAAIAADEWARRHDRAVRKVASGDLAAGEANALLRPWLALACRCGADLPELAEPLAEARAITGSREHGRFYTEGEARVVVADDICPLPQVRETLAHAREDALERSENAPADAARLARARGLCTLATRFGVPMQPRAADRSAQEAA